jgi:CRISPR-associated protein Cas1
MSRDLHELPKLRDGLTYLYLEHGIIDKGQQSVELLDQDGRTRIPVAALSLLMLGPGTSITHAAIRVLGDSGCLVAWCGEEGVRFYAQGSGETRKAQRLIKQAALVSDPGTRLEVVMRMYRYRFPEGLPDGLSIEQIRGYEGVRVREAYAQASQTYGVVWTGRQYDRRNWSASSPANRALSAANSCLNGICHAAIVSVGLSPGLGFIHTGFQLSFVYDIADLYKAELTIPLAFRLASESAGNLESRVRHACRDAFRDTRLLERILPDMDEMLGISEADLRTDVDMDQPAALPPSWWTPPAALAAGGVADQDEGAGGCGGEE